MEKLHWKSMIMYPAQKKKIQKYLSCKNIQMHHKCKISSFKIFKNMSSLLIGICNKRIFEGHKMRVYLQNAIVASSALIEKSINQLKKNNVNSFSIFLSFMGFIK